jgi:hypothetical protein
MSPGEPSRAGPQGEPAVDSLAGFVLVLFAKVLGYAVLLVCAVLALRRPPWQLSVSDLVFWACVVAIPPAQRAAVRYEAAAGGAAARSTVRRLAVHAAVAALVWVAAHSVQALS